MIYIFALISFSVLLFMNQTSIRKHEPQITFIIIIIAIIQQILLYSSYFFLLDFHLGESLPFHISRINSILGILYLIKKDNKIFTLLSFFSVFAWLSFIMPMRVHPIGQSFFINHVMTLLIPYYGMIIEGYQIKKEGKQTTLYWLIVYTLFCLFLNPLVDGNYFYLKHEPIFSNLSNIVYVPLLILFSYILFYGYEKLYRLMYKTLIA